MRPIFRHRLVNRPTGDPALYLDFNHERRAFLFDVGDLTPLATKELHKVSHVFVTHTHMDHFMGFDRLLRVSLGRERTLHVVGPPGITENVIGKLGAYTWNLVGNYFYNLRLEVHELDGETMTSTLFPCRKKFAPSPLGEARVEHGVVVEEPSFLVRAVRLSHEIPSLAFSFEERFHVNIKKSELVRFGFRQGPWLTVLREAVLAGMPDDFPLAAEYEDGRTEDLPLGRLKEEIVAVSDGIKVVYAADLAYTGDNVEKLAGLARDADYLYLEAHFMAEDEDKAVLTHHLTARQAGEIAREASAKRLVVFHLSPKYRGREEEVIREAEEAFGAEV